MVCALARSARLSGGDSGFVFCKAESQKHCDWSSNWSFWFVAPGVCGRLLEKTGGADNHGAVCVHTQSSLLWKFDFGGWRCVGHALVDFGGDSRNLLCRCVLRRDAKGRRRTARPFWGRLRALCEESPAVFSSYDSSEIG